MILEVQGRAEELERLQEPKEQSMLVRLSRDEKTASSASLYLREKLMRKFQTWLIVKSALTEPRIEKFLPCSALEAPFFKLVREHSGTGTGWPALLLMHTGLASQLGVQASCPVSCCPTVYLLREEIGWGLS